MTGYDGKHLHCNSRYREVVIMLQTSTCRGEEEWNFNLEIILPGGSACGEDGGSDDVCGVIMFQ